MDTIKFLDATKDSTFLVPLRKVSRYEKASMSKS